MNKKTLFFASAILAVSALVRAQAVGENGASRAALFPAVSAQEAPALKELVPTSGGIPASIVGAIMTLDVNVPEQRALLAPLKLAHEKGESSAFYGGLKIVQTHREATSRLAASADASLTQMEEALSRFSELRRIVALYEPEAAGQFELDYMAAESRITTMRAATVQASAEKIAAELNQPKKDEPVTTSATDGRAAVADAMIKELRGSADTSYSEGLIDKLEAMASETDAGESLQRAIAQGMIADLRTSADTDYSEYVIDSLQRIAKQTAFSSIQSVVVEGVMQDVHRSADTDYSNYGLSTVEDIAKGATDKGVKGLAIAHMLKEIKDSADRDYSEETQVRVERIGESAGGLANIPVPELHKPVPPAPKAEVSFGKQLSEGASAHPLGAFFGLLALAGTVITLGATSFPLLGIAIAGALLLWVGVRGLYTDHPVAGFFQLLVIGDLFEKAATAGAALGAGHWLALVLGGVLGASLADWSFKKNHPVLGFFLNMLLMWMFLAAVIGPHAATAFISISTN